MKQTLLKVCAMVTALALTFTAVPQQATVVKATSAPAYKVTRSSFYENSSAKGVYTYTVKNLKKGYKVKWYVVGAGKKYISFSKTSSTVKTTTASTKITFNSNSASVKDKKVLIGAKVYDTKNKLIKTVKDKAVLKVQATDITMDTSKVGEDLDSLPLGSSLDFDAKLEPKNTTSSVYWHIEDKTGNDCSSEINEDGVFTPSKAGTYTIKAIARNSATGTALATDIKTVTVGTSLVAVRQISANQFVATFNSDVKDTVKASDFSILASAGTSSLIPKSIKFSADGKTATVTTSTNFKNATMYTVTYGSFAKTINASVGAVKDVKILTTTVQANKATDLEYALYDENGIDVSKAVNGTVSFDGDITNGYITSDNKLFMTTEGKEARINITYMTADGSKFVATQVITCIPQVAEEASSYKFTITDSPVEPDFKATDFKAKTQLSIDDVAYAHFGAFDENGTAIQYDNVSYISSNDDMLIVNSNGQMLPIKEGTVTVIVKVAQGKSELTYPFTVNILGKRALNSISLSAHSVSMSNSYEPDYVRYITVTGKDQYGNDMNLSDATFDLQETSNKSLPVSYDPATQQISVRTGASAVAGSYNYKFTITSGQKTMTTSFIVIVTNTPATGAIGYVPVISSQNFDLKIDSTTKANSNITIRLEKMINGVFVEYADIVSATIQRNGLYYTNDLTLEPQKTEVVLPAGKEVSLTPFNFSFNQAVGECKKAPVGSYSVALKYYDNTGTLRTATTSLILKDTQKVPTVTIKKLESEISVSNALALVNECLSVSDGVFESCTVTGTTAVGDAISVAVGEKIHIKTVTVRSTVTTSENAKVYVYHTINVDKTFTNK